MIPYVMEETRALAGGRAVAGQPRAGRRLWPPLLLSGLALGAALYLRTRDVAPAGWVAGLWLLAITAFLYGCWARDRLSDDVRPLGLGWTSEDSLGLLCALLCGLVLRLAGLGQAPATMLGDEGQMAMAARDVLAGRLDDPFATAWLSHPTLWFFLQAGSLQIFGDTLAGVRALSALIGGATVAMTFVLARLLYGRQVALIAALLLASYHLHIHFSRLALNNIADPFFGTLLALWVAAGLRSRRWLMFGLAGVTLGLALYFYHGTRLFWPLLAMLGAIGLCAQRRRWREPAWRAGALAMLLLVLAGAVLAAGPLAQSFLRHPESFMLRYEAVGVNPEWLQKTAQERGVMPGKILLEQLGRAALAFHVYGDSYGFYDRSRPFLWGAGQLLLPLGLLVALARARRWAYQLPLAWLLLTIVFGGMLFRYTPGSPRYVTLAPVVCLLNAFALQLVFAQLGRLVRRFAPRRERAARSLASLSVAALCLASPLAYFAGYLAHERFGGVTDVGNALARYLEHQPEGTQLVMLKHSGNNYGGLRMIAFLAPQVLGRDLESPIARLEDVPTASGGKLTIYAATPERLEELRIVERRYPGGSKQALRWLDSAAPLVYIYAVVAPVEPPGVRVAPYDPTLRKDF